MVGIVSSYSKVNKVCRDTNYSMSTIYTHMSKMNRVTNYSIVTQKRRSYPATHVKL